MTSAQMIKSIDFVQRDFKPHQESQSVAAFDQRQSYSNVGFSNKCISMSDFKGNQQVIFSKSQQKELEEDDESISMNAGKEDEEEQSPTQLDRAQSQQARESSPYKITVLNTLEDHQYLAPTQNSSFKAITSCSEGETLTPGKKNWSKIKNVLKGISLFSSYDVEVITKPSDIDIHLNTSSKSMSPRMEKYPIQGNRPNVQQKNKEDASGSELLNNLRREAQENAHKEQIRLIDDLKSRKQFFEAIQNGTSQDLVFIEEYLKNDPKKYLLIDESPDRRMNKADTFGQTPMYSAAKNGNITVLQILLKYKANPAQLSFLSNDQSASDTALCVASRWGHVKVVEFLTQNYQWDKKAIKAAKKASQNTEINKLLGKL